MFSSEFNWPKVGYWMRGSDHLLTKSLNKKIKLYYKEKKADNLDPYVGSDDFSRSS